MTIEVRGAKELDKRGTNGERQYEAQLPSLQGDSRKPLLIVVNDKFNTISVTRVSHSIITFAQSRIDAGESSIGYSQSSSFDLQYLMFNDVSPVDVNVTDGKLIVLGGSDKRVFTISAEDISKGVSAAMRTNADGRIKWLPRIGADDKSSVAKGSSPLGGIDMNAVNLNLQIKRDGKGVVLPASRQDWENVRIDGLVPEIIQIRPFMETPLYSQLQALP